MTTQPRNISAAAPGPPRSADSATSASSFPVGAGSEDAITSSLLLGQKGVCIIVHNAEQYILRRTRNNKLILTK